MAIHGHALTRISISALLLSLTLPFSNLQAAADSLIPSSGPSEEERVIRSVYAKLTQLNAAAPHLVSFELASFETVGRSSFDQIRYADVATLPGGEHLQLERVTRNVDGGDARYVVYELTWQPASDYLSSPEGEMVAPLSLSDVLLRVEDPKPALADSLTRYRVTVHLQGRSRTYDAAFLWFREAGQIVEFKALDHITGGVDLATGEELPEDPWQPPLLRAEGTPATPLRFITAALCDDPSGTPVVIDLAGDGFRFTSVEEGVHFNFDGVGAAERMSWTEPGTDDAFLVADLNRNGRIDNGRELFGDLTPQPQDRGAVHGYNALRQYDEGVGGNGDGMITRDDSYFAELMLWRDANHNGLSEPEELTWLADTLIEGIDLDYVESRRRDRFGNELRYTSRVPLLRSGPEQGEAPGRPLVMATDVILRFGPL